MPRDCEREILHPDSKGSIAALEGAPREQQGSKGEHRWSKGGAKGRTEYRILNSVNPRISRNVVNKVERRGGKYKITID